MSKLAQGNGNGNGVVISAIVGGLVGAAAALLFAPKSGERLRADLSDQLQTFGQRAKEMKDTLCSKTKEAIDESIEVVREKSSEAASAINSMAPEEKDMVKLGKEMDKMPTNTEVVKKGFSPDPAQ